MQFLMLIRIETTADYKAGKRPPGDLDTPMGELIGQWSKTGAFVSAAGLRPTSQATRVSLRRGKVSTTDGPFTEAKEVIGGFFLLEAADLAAATAMTQRFVDLHQKVLGDRFFLECEVRQVEA